MPPGPIFYTGLIQGLGLGFVFVPTTTIAYSTLPRHTRTDAASMYSLVRNIGSSLGISVVFTLLVRWTQINHAEIASRITPYSLPGGLPEMWNTQNTGGLTALNAEITRQAAAIGFINNFELMMWLIILTLPLVLMFKPVRHHAGGAASARTRTKLLDA
jgi:DHA2 family multidrug resistance protein